jgi:hypothetical protein
VPPGLAEHAPDGSDRVAFCPGCLRVYAAETDARPTGETAADPLPEGETGAAIALAVGLLDSLALNRRAVVDLCGHAERAGADPLLWLARLADGADPTEQVLDLDRRVTQLEEFL